MAPQHGLSTQGGPVEGECGGVQLTPHKFSDDQHLKVNMLTFAVMALGQE